MGSGELDPDAAVADSPLVPEAAISVGEPERTQPWRPLPATGAIHVFAGPDAERKVLPTPGSHLVGREHSDINLPCDAKVPKRHARIDVSWTGEATVVDLGSRNGTRADEAGAPGPVVPRPNGEAYPAPSRCAPTR